MDVYQFLGSMSEAQLERQISRYDHSLTNSHCPHMFVHWERGRKLAVEILDKKRQQRPPLKQLTIC